MLRPTALIAFGALALGVAACVYVDKSEDSHRRAHGPVATAVIYAKSGSEVEGHAVFREVTGGVEAEVYIENAAPGWHGVHIHETGDCSSDDGKSAGGHFNPNNHDHGAPMAAVHHLGDLGNIKVRENGSGHLVIIMPELTVSAGPNSVRGRAIIVHEKIDDLVSQPTGAAGARIGCGVIE